MITLRIYNNTSQSPTIYHYASTARAATIARNLYSKVDLLKDGRLAGMKEAGSNRINWINKDGWDK
jgi:hypothetical protein